MLLMKAAEQRDTDTGEHVARVAAYVQLIAEALGLLADECRQLSLASTMHDVGKIGVSDAILLKPGRLTADERTEMQEHAERGRRILETSSSDLVRLAAEIAAAHHERFDGEGYPSGLKGEAIPLGGRIVAVADVFDALTSERPYKKAWPLAEARAHLEPTPAAISIRPGLRVALGRRPAACRRGRRGGLIAAPPCGERRRRRRHSAVAVTSSFSRITPGSPMEARSAMPSPPGSLVFAAIESLPGFATKRATAWPIAFAWPELPSIAGIPTAATMPNSLRRSSGDFFCFAASWAMSFSTRPPFSIRKSALLTVAPRSATSAMALSGLNTSLVTPPIVARRLVLPMLAPRIESSRS